MSADLAPGGAPSPTVAAPDGPDGPDDHVDPHEHDDPVTQARSAVTVGLYVSATRCVLTYLVAPSLGLLGIALGVAGLLLQVLGLVSSVWGAVRLHRLGSRWWPAYAVLALVVAVSTVLATGDLTHLGGRA